MSEEGLRDWTTDIVRSQCRLVLEAGRGKRHRRKHCQDERGGRTEVIGRGKRSDETEEDRATEERGERQAKVLTAGLILLLAHDDDVIVRMFGPKEIRVVLDRTR